ncbi:MAG: hypothetical protein Q4P33_03670 [Flaviflexus sp.]|nr:hypothetical protein [Flaviflexus sp.]
MSATATAPRIRRRPVIAGLPRIEVVPTPAPMKGLAATVVTCALIFLGALAAVFVLNTKMVDGAYEIQRTNVLLNDLADERERLYEGVTEASTTSALRGSAEEMGMVPATEIRHLDLEAGVVTQTAGSEAR